MKVKVRKILLCVFFALFIVTLFTASFSLGRYSSVQSSESDYDDDFEYTLYDSIVVNTIDEFFAAISNGYNYIIIGDAIKDPLIIAGSMSDIRDDLIIDLNGHEIQRNSRDPLLNVTTGFTLTIIDRVGTGSMYNPVGSVIQVSGGTLTVQNGIFESGPRSDNSRDAKRHNDVNVNDYNEYVKDTPDDDELYSTPGGGSIRDTDTVTVYRNSNIGTGSTSNTYGDSIGTVALPIITPKATGRGVVNGSMYFDDAEEERIYYTCNEYNVIKDDTYLYYTFESDNMQYSEAADKSTANYYYQYYVEGGNLNADGSYPTDYFNYVGTKEQVDSNIRVTVYVFNDVKYYAAKQSGYTDSSGTPGFAAVKMQSGNLYVRGGTYYSYFGEENTFGVQSTGGLMTVNPTGSNAIYFYAYQNGVCVECTVDTPTKTEMLNISSGNFYSELGDTVRVTNGNLVIGEGKFTKDVSSSDIQISTGNLQNLTDAELAELYSYNNSVVNISGGTLKIETSANFTVTGSGVTGIRASSKATVNTNNATFNFYGAGNSTLDASFTRGVYTDGGSVTFDGTTGINLAQAVNGQSLTSRYNVGVLAGNDGTVIFNGSSSITVGGNTNPSGGNYGIYSTGGGITCGQDSNSSTTIKIAENSASTGNYGIYSGGGSIATYGKTEITLGNTANLSTSNYGIYSSGGTVTLGNEGTGSAIIKILGSSDNSSTRNNYAAYLVGGGIELNGAEAEMEVYGAHSAGIYTSQAEGGTAATININNQFKCSIVNSGATLSSAAIIANGGTIGFNLDNSIAEQGYGITSTDLGIVAKSGANVNFTSGSLSLTSTRGTSIYVEGGNITIGSEQNNSPLLDVTCQLGQNLHGGDAVTWDGSISTTANRYNAIFVSDGSLISNGILNVKHVGVKNETEYVRGIDDSGSITIDDQPVYGGQLHTQFDIKSYAVRVESAKGSTSTVTINSGDITNSVGGGVYVSGGNVTLGQQGLDTLTVSSTGNTTISDEEFYFGREPEAWRDKQDYIWYQAYNGVWAADNWAYRLTTDGGRALEVDGGSVTVYSGSYTANQGDGLLVRGGSAYIFGGTFRGNDSYYADGGGPVCGPAASYAFKMYGGTANIYGGRFGSTDQTGSGAFIMGTGATAETGWATANIYGGSFVVSENATSGGQAAISALEYATILFDENVHIDNVPDDRTIIATGRAGGLVIEGYSKWNDYTQEAYTAPGNLEITIESGTFSSTYGVGSSSDGIWYNNVNATLTINDGNFNGARSGIYTERMPNGGKITINNGAFTGTDGFNLGSQLNNVQASDRVLISYGTFTGKNSGLLLTAGLTYADIVHIEGGQFYGDNYGIYFNATATITQGDGWGFNVKGGTITGGNSGIYINVSPSRHAINISGGTISATNGSSRGIYFSRACNVSDAVTIGGTVQVSASSDALYFVAEGTATSAVTITGGTFTNNSGINAGISYDNGNDFMGNNVQISGGRFYGRYGMWHINLNAIAEGYAAYRNGRGSPLTNLQVRLWTDEYIEVRPNP